MFDSVVVGSGTRLQSGIPKADRSSFNTTAFQIIRGVVVATYVLDDPNHPLAEFDAQPVAVYCDVLTYGREIRLFRNCFVSQERGGMHSGKIWKPRAASIDKSGNTVDLNKGTNPADLDGDHVLIQFIDGNINQPVITAGIHHPSADVGNEEKEIGNRMRLKLEDGDPDFCKHKGAFYGIDKEGNFVVDTRQAYAKDEFETDASEPVPLEDGSAGNHIIRLPKGSKLSVSIEDGETFEVDLKDADALLKLGDGAVGVALATHLETLYNNLKAYIEGAIVPTGVGPSGTILAGSGPAPIWDANIASTRLTIPDQP
jgi:hypothetical protein